MHTLLCLLQVNTSSPQPSPHCLFTASGRPWVTPVRLPSTVTTSTQGFMGNASRAFRNIYSLVNWNGFPENPELLWMFFLISMKHQLHIAADPKDTGRADQRPASDLESPLPLSCPAWTFCYLTPRSWVCSESLSLKTRMAILEKQKGRFLWGHVSTSSL